MSNTESLWYVYVLKCNDETLYTGITTDLQRRIEEHNSSPKGAKYTRIRRPVEMIYFEQCKDKSGATIRELEIKKLSRAKKLELIK